MQGLECQSLYSLQSFPIFDCEVEQAVATAMYKLFKQKDHKIQRILHAKNLMPTYLGLNLGLNFWEDFSDPTGLLSVMRAGLSLRFVLCLDGARDPNIIQSSQDIIIKHTHHPTHTQFFHAYRINVYHCISQNAKFGTSLLFSTRSDPSCF